MGKNKRTTYLLCSNKNILSSTDAATLQIMLQPHALCVFCEDAVCVTYKTSDGMGAT